MKMRRNSEAVGLVVGLAILLIGGLLMILPPLAGVDGMDGGFALQFLGLFLAITGLVTSGIFAYRARRLAAMFQGQRLLAHWRYDPRQVEDQARRDLATTSQNNRMLLFIVAFFVVACTVLFVGIGFLEGEEDGMPMFVGIMFGVLAIVAVFALGMPFLQYRRAVRGGGEALIAANGLYVNGVLHTWNAPLAYLDGVLLSEEDGQARLVFNLRSLSRTGPGGYEAYSVEVPVPPGQEATARQVEQHFLQVGLAGDWSA